VQRPTDLLNLNPLHTLGRVLAQEEKVAIRECGALKFAVRPVAEDVALRPRGFHRVLDAGW